MSINIAGQRKQRLIDDQNISLNTTLSSSKINGLISDIPASGKNILHNWDFRHNLSIVNQRGLLRYVGAGYGIDRWFSNTVAATVELLDNGLELTRRAGSSVAAMLVQPVEFASRYAGKTVTFSALLSPGEFDASFRIRINANGSTFVISPGADSSGLISITTTLPADLTTLDARLAYTTTVSEVDQSTLIQCVKLELGSVSTLANDLPMDFGQELAACQRYQLNLSRSRNSPSTIAGRATRILRDSLQFVIRLPASLRILPTVANNAFIVTAMGNTDITPETGFTFNIWGRDHHIIVSAYKDNHGLQDASLSVVSNTILDSNL